MTQIEKEFGLRLAAVGNDARACATHAYCELTLHHRFGSDPDLRDRVNLYAGFWNAALGGLQASAFVGMGRIYDGGRNHFSGAELLRHAQQNVGMFSRRALRARKVSEGWTATAAAEYALHAYDCPPKGLAGLDAAFKVKRALYNEKVKPIRDRVFAHAGCPTADERNNLFGKLFVRTFEVLAVFPLELYDAIWHLYVNGREPVLANAESNIVEVVRNLPDKYTGGMTHMLAARDTTDFLKWFAGLADVNAKD